MKYLGFVLPSDQAGDCGFVSAPRSHSGPVCPPPHLGPGALRAEAWGRTNSALSDQIVPFSARHHRCFRFTFSLGEGLHVSAHLVAEHRSRRTAISSR